MSNIAVSFSKRLVITNANQQHNNRALYSFAQHNDRYLDSSISLLNTLTLSAETHLWLRILSYALH